MHSLRYSLMFQYTVHCVIMRFMLPTCQRMNWMRDSIPYVSTLHDAKHKTLSTNLGSKNSEYYLSVYIALLTVVQFTLFPVLSGLVMVSASLYVIYLVRILRKYWWVIVDVQHMDSDCPLCLVHQIWNLDLQLIFRSFFKIQCFNQHHYPSVQSIANLVFQNYSLWQNWRWKLDSNPHHKLISESQSCQAKNLKWSWPLSVSIKSHPLKYFSLIVQSKHFIFCPMWFAVSWHDFSYKTHYNWIKTLKNSWAQ